MVERKPKATRFSRLSRRLFGNPPRAGVLALLVLLSLPALAWADEFPRGPGFYFSPVKLVLIVVVYFVWVSICNWVDKDTETVSLPADKWNGLLLGAGALGLLIVWMLPAFFLSWLLLVIGVAAAALGYVYVRNQKVDPAERVLTEQHLRQVFSRLFSRKRRGKAEASGKAGVPVKFFGRSYGQSAGDDDIRVARAAESKGYKGALEMVYEACNRRATDIHLEPTKDEMTVRMRIDGMLINTDPFSRVMGDAVVNIFKVLCNLDITEKRKAQDGSFSAQVEDRIVDFRVATAGSVSGEKLVMRILDQSRAIGSLTELGMRDRVREQVDALVTKANGMLVGVCTAETGK